MKRLILVAFMLMLVLASCSRPTYGILEYQDKNIEAECIINEKFRCILEKKEDVLSLKILEPRELSSVSFVVDNDGATAISGDTKIPLGKESVDGIVALLSTLSLDERDLTEAKEAENGAVLSFVNEKGSYTLEIGKNQMPAAAEIIGDGYAYKITFETIKIE